MTTDGPTNEHLLSLPNGGTLAYAQAGNPASSDVVIFFHGVFGVGSIKRIPPVLKEKDILLLHPTLPGWG